MWKHKNDIDLKEALEKKANEYKNIRRPITIASVIFIIAILKVKIGFYLYDFKTFEPISWETLFKEKFFLCFIIAFAVFLIVYIYQIISKHILFSPPETMICLKCQRIKVDDRNYDCDCGGKYIPLYECDWIEDEKRS